jgi:hypothetical protein
LMMLQIGLWGLLEAKLRIQHSWLAPIAGYAKSSVSMSHCGFPTRVFRYTLMSAVI